MILLRVAGSVSWENLEGGQEASQQSGEAYRQRVEAYLESGEFLSVGDPHSGTSDIRLVRPAHNEEKVFRVETKNTKASLASETLITEIARQFIDSYTSSEDFEFHIYAPKFADQPRWKDVFRDRTRKQEEVDRFYSQICECHTLSEDELERFRTLDFDDFWRFLEKISVKKAGYKRLAELIDENESRGRRQKNWEFYIRENEPVYERAALTPNFVRIAKYPETIWVLPSLVIDHTRVYEENPRHLPIWFEAGDVFSLIPPDWMADSLRTFVNTDETMSYSFGEWIADPETDDRLATTLLNRQLTWRGTQSNEHCVAVRHDDNPKLIITARENGSVQQTLAGHAVNNDSGRSDSVSGYVATRDMGSATAHRYGDPLVKRYDTDYYVFIRTGWLFTADGFGDRVITGSRATKLHNTLNKATMERITNQRAQLRQWQEYLKMGVGSASNPGTGELQQLESSQRMQFERPDRLELDERPPKNATERDALMEGDRIEHR